MSFLRRKPVAKTDVTTSAVRKSCEKSAPAANCGVACLRKLVRKVKRQLSETGRQRSFQCRYDPLSYSLNFDGGACGSLSDDDEDYYLRFYAFSSRFAAHEKRPS